MKWTQIHKDFTYNGKSFASRHELILTVLDYSSEVGDFLKDWFSTDDFIVVQTSGSTGKPKSISLDKEHVINSALATGAFLDLQAKSTALLCLPIDYIAGKLMWIRALVLGWELTVIRPSSTPLENIDKRFDFTAFVPLQLQNSLHKLYLFNTVIVGGGAISKTLEIQLQNQKAKVFATYGMTETITHIAMKPLNHQSYKPSFYRTLPDVSIYKDERGCLVIHAPKVADKVIFTNDIVELISNYQFEWLGRYDNVINSGGVKLHPEQIEAKISPILSSRFFVAGIKDDQLGQKLVLVVEGLTREVDFSACSLSKFEIPKATFFIDTFVETKSGKIVREKTLSLLGLKKPDA